MACCKVNKEMDCTQCKACDMVEYVLSHKCEYQFTYKTEGFTRTDTFDDVHDACVTFDRAVEDDPRLYLVRPDGTWELIAKYGSISRWVLQILDQADNMPKYQCDTDSMIEICTERPNTACSGCKMCSTLYTPGE